MKNITIVLSRIEKRALFQDIKLYWNFFFNVKNRTVFQPLIRAFAAHTQLLAKKQVKNNIFLLFF